MKHQTINLVKFSSLSRKLKLPRCWTIGVLEGIWLFAQTNARDGDLSRFSDDDIAAWLDWPGDSSELVGALVLCGWLDRYDIEGDDSKKGLRVHDWDAHKPNWLRGVEARQASSKPRESPSAQPSHLLGVEPSSEPPSPPLPPLTLTQPSPSLPNLNPLATLANSERSVGDDKIVITEQEYSDVVDVMNKLRDDLMGSGAKCTSRDKELIWKSVCLIHYQFNSPNWVGDLTRTVREARPKSPMAYFKACLSRKLEKLGVDLNDELELVTRGTKTSDARVKVGKCELT